MRIFLTVLILTIGLQSFCKADDIRDFEIEGMSVGNSLLDYMSAQDIKNNHLNLYHSKSKFIAINFPGNKNTYEYVYIYVKRNDKNYKIHLIRAMNTVKNKNSCLKIKKQIVKEMKSLFQNATFQEGEQKHYYYKKSTQYISQFYYGSDGRFSDAARAECLIITKDVAKKYNVTSTLEVIMQYGGEFGRWLETGDARPSEAYN